jgi:hypothetical protein
MVPFDQIHSWTLFDTDLGIDSARAIREYVIPDFSNWKDHGSHQEGVRPAAARSEGRRAGWGDCLTAGNAGVPKRSATETTQ